MRERRLLVGLTSLKAAAALLMLAMSGCVLSACGGDGDAPVTKNQVVRFGDDVNLRARDVPAMAVIAASFAPNGGVPPFGSCATELRVSDVVGTVSSPSFRGSGGHERRRLELDLPVLPVEGARSLVYVTRDDLAQRNVTAARRAGMPACVARRKAAEAAGPLVGREPQKGQVTAEALPFPLPGVKGYGIRVRGTLAATIFHRKTRPSYYEDTFGFAVGPAEIVLHADGAPQPVPSGVEHRLLALLYRRATTHTLS
jgi:hypothetical protein